jgi:hypothetical protein
MPYIYCALYIYIYINKYTSPGNRDLVKVSCVVAPVARTVKVKLAIGHTEADILGSESNWIGNIWHE